MLLPAVFIIQRYIGLILNIELVRSINREREMLCRKFIEIIILFLSFNKGRNERNFIRSHSLTWSIYLIFIYTSSH